MIIFISRLEAKNFKGHRELEIGLAERVKITGKNGEGKSSIGDAVTWCLYGTDTLGNTLDPTPLYEHDGEISTTLYLTIDEKVIKLKRVIEDGKNTFSINDIPKKATEFKELVEALVDKDLFLSIFNPNYFSSQHWKEQRSQLLKYSKEPLNKEVLERMVNVHRVALEEPLKKHSLNDLDKLHKERFKQRDTEVARAGAKLTTLKEQYEKALGSKGGDLAEIEVRMRELEKEWNEANQVNLDIQDKQKRLYELHAKAEVLRHETHKKKEEVEKIKAEPVPDRCDACGQTLDEHARKNLNHTHSNRLEQAKQEGRELVAELKKIQEDIASLGELAKPKDLADLQQQLAHYRQLLMGSERIGELKKDVEQAQDDYEKVRFERNESQTIVEAIKSFVDVKAEMMARSVNELFDTLRVQLFEKQKNDTVKQTFELMMDGKPYAKLSTAEKIRCGLEFIAVLQKQSNVIAPTFIDNAESILEFNAPEGQLITATVKDVELTIEGGND